MSILFFCMADHKGFNIRENAEGLELNVHVEQFTQFLQRLPKTSKGWISFKIYKRDDPDPRGFSHNMTQVIRNQPA